MRWFTLILCLLLAVSVTVNVINCQGNDIEDVRHAGTDTLRTHDTLVRRDTVKKTDFVPYTQEVVRLETLYKDTVLPIEVRLYKDTVAKELDTLYADMTVSGIRPNLDSVSYRWVRHQVTNTVTVTKYKERKRSWRDRISIGPSATVGYDPFNKQWGATIGVGVGIDLCQ